MVGSIVDRAFVRHCVSGVDAIVHAATLHKPHVATHSKQAFIDTNISGTLNLLEEAAAAGVRAFVFTSSTSVFGRALTPPSGAPAAWITEDVVPLPKNIYGVTKLAAEQLCELFHRTRGLPAIVLRTSRFFPEPDDRKETREAYDDGNAKANECLYRRADIDDVVSAHLLALDKAASRSEAGRCSRASIASMSTIERARTSVGSRATTSRASSSCCAPAKIRAARWHAPSARRCTTPKRSPKDRIPWNRTQV